MAVILQRADAESDPPGRLAENLRRLRQQRGLTLDALALRCGVDRKSVV